MEEHKLPEFMFSRVYSTNNLETAKPILQNQDESRNFHRLCRFSQHRYSTSEMTAFDLKPPPPAKSDPHCETIAEHLFSSEHLQVILKDHAYFQRFRGFLTKYQPQSIPTLNHYLESRKALTAIRYANAIAGQMAIPTWQPPNSLDATAAAMIDQQFEKSSQEALHELVTDVLPIYITHRIVTLVTECLVKEITGSGTPLTREFMHGLAEVYCLTDARQADNPVVFASEEFYNTTQYGHEYVIGKNCRFLQGPKSQTAALRRMSNAIQSGHEANEILLNYRRDGSPFLNLVMVSPLMDSRGQIRYHIGAHIDVSRLLEGGKGLDSFRNLLDASTEAPGATDHKVSHAASLSLLRDLSGLFNDDETDIVKIREREAHMHGFGRPESMISLTKTDHRRFVGMEDTEYMPWSSQEPLTARRLQGVYQNYILVRPYPSLRIIFTSPSLRIPGLCQSKLMDRIGGPQHVREGILRAFEQGIGVTAKISWLTQAQRSTLPQDFPYRDEDASIRTGDSESPYEGRPRWIHCTPLLGSDMKPGVIMIVMVDREEITGSLAPPRASPLRPVRSWQRLHHAPAETPSKPMTPLQTADTLPPSSESSASRCLSNNPYKGCWGKEASSILDTNRVAKVTTDDMITYPRPRTVSYSARNSIHSTLAPTRASSASHCSKRNDSNGANRPDTPRGEGTGEVSPPSNDHDTNDECTPTNSVVGNRESYLIEDPAKEYVITGVGLVKPQKIDTRKMKPLGGLMKRCKKTA